MASSTTLTANLQLLPSIFEITAAEYLDQLLYPALNKLFEFLNLKYTIKCNKYQFSDDYSSIVVGALQYFYLHKHNASFGECFYSLQRVSSNCTVLSNFPESLTNHQKYASMVFLLFLPYYEKKLKERDYNHISTKSDKFILNSIKLLNCTKVIYTLSYLAKLTNIHSPVLKLLGLKLNYKPPADKNKTTFFLLKSIELFAFLLQFIQWWYTKKYASTDTGIGELKNPKSYSNLESDKMIRNMPGLCPICLQKLRIPTASRISGYVYCFKCIMNHMKFEQACPCTGYPMNVEDLIRVYDDEE